MNTTQEFKKITAKVPQQWLDLVNQIFEVEKKAALLKEEHSLQRNINRLKDLIENDLFKGTSTVGLSYHNPLGEKYSETRTDCDASIAGLRLDDLEIMEVIKPIIYYTYSDNQATLKTIVQKAVVVVESKF
jgi:hypothetical protein